MRSSTDTLVSALRILSQDIQTDDYVANAALLEAADRLEEVEADNGHYGVQNDVLTIQNTNLKLLLKEAEAYADKLVQHKDMACLPKDLEILREANGLFAEEIEDLKDEAIHLAQYARVLQLENEQLEAKLTEQSDNNGMKKFAMNLDKLKDEVLFDVILFKSLIAREYVYKDFYTNAEGVPEDWYNQFIEDMREAVHYKYKDEHFYVVYTKSILIEDDDNDLIDDSIAYIFYKDRVYALDNYYTDCEIFQSVLKSYV